MAEVIDFKGKKKRKDDLSKTDQLESLQSLIRCNYCARRCAKCGVHGEATKLVTRPPMGISFRLCAACLDEYHQLVGYLESGQDPDRPSWHNREWIRLWLAWLEYQGAVGQYLSSSEVIRILEDLQKD